ncbi:Hypothetical protein SCF082_LOCUS33390, partial [Durusdinium trenchii]
ALCSIVPFLKPFEVVALADHFTERKLEVRWPRVVNYVWFCQAVDKVFGPSRLEKSPMQKVPLPGEGLRSAGGYFRPKSRAGDKDRLNVILNKVASLCHTRGVELSSCLRVKSKAECPRGTGKVPACVLLQRFPFMSDFNSEDMDILVRRYTDAHDGFVRTQALERDVLHIIQDRGAEDAALGIHSDPDEDDAAEEALPAGNSGLSLALSPPPSRSTRTAPTDAPHERNKNAKVSSPSSSSSSRRARPQTAPLRAPVSVSSQEVLSKIVAIMRKRSLRLRERFIDFDRFRKGVVAQSQMRTVLAILGLDLQRAELEALDKAYDSVGPGDAATDPRTFFRYGDFCADIARMEVAVASKTDGPRRFSKFSANSPLASLLNMIKAKARSRRLELFTAFAERNRGGIRFRVRRSTMLRIMHALGFLLKDIEVDRLCEAFSASPVGDEAGFDYYRFCKVVDPFMAAHAPDWQKEKTKTAKPREARTTTMYFNFSNEVVPHPKLSRPASAPHFRH